MLQPNKFGKYKKEEILKEGYKILEYGLTATDIKKITGVNLTIDQRLKYCIGFKTASGMRGYVPVFELDEIYQAIEHGELKSNKL